MDERDLVRKILDGDEQAFAQFYEAHKRRLARTAVHFLGAAHPALEDVVQDTFAAALPKLKEFRFESSLYTWLNRFTVNFCFQALNKGKKTVAVETEQLEVLARTSDPAMPEGLRAFLHDAIAALSPEHRQVIELKDLQGHSYLDIARRLKLAPGTVMSRLARARQELRRRLEPRKKALEAFWKA